MKNHEKKHEKGQKTQKINPVKDRDQIRKIRTNKK